MYKTAYKQFTNANSTIRLRSLLWLAQDRSQFPRFKVGWCRAAMTFFTATRGMKKVIQTQTFFSVNEKGTKNILKCQRKTDKDSGKKWYNNMFCLRWIVFVCPERFGQWQQQYLVSEGIKRPKLDSCDSKKLSVARRAANPEPIGKFFFVFEKSRFFIIFSMSFCHV